MPKPKPVDPSKILTRLSSVHDASSRPSYVSLYVDGSEPRWESLLESRANEIRAALPDEKARKDFDQSFDQALKAFVALKAKDRLVRGAAVFASKRHKFLEAVALGGKTPTRLIVDSSPYVRPLARFAAAHEPVALVLLDGQDAALHVATLARAQRRAAAGHRSLGRHGRGGMSQMRFQRHRQGVVNRFYDEVLAHLDRAIMEEGVARIIVAGPGQAKRQFVARLPPATRKKVVAVEDVEWDPAAEQPTIRQLLRLSRRHASETTEETLEELRGLLMRDELASTGGFDVVRAARDGRVDTLVVQKDAVAGARKCEAHQTFFEPGKACQCGRKGAEVDLLNESVEYTLRSHGKIVFAPRDDPLLKGVGGVAAVLRW